MFNVEQMFCIFDDQKSYLEGAHMGEICEDVSKCPPDHFSENEDIEDIFTRQEIMKIIMIESHLHSERLKTEQNNPSAIPDK